MVFSSSVFLFLFLPAVLVGTFLAPQRLRNLVLLGASLFFYAWGEGFYVGLMGLSIGFNWALGAWVDRLRGRRAARAVVGLAVVGNLTLLGFFKYANFLVDNLSALLGVVGMGPVELAPVHLPIGISFFTFQALSYVIDVHRGQAEASKSPLEVGVYVSLFPQLIAGPIVRYKDVALQLRQRRVTRAGFASGIRRFAIGLAKKMLIANAVAVPADEIFALPTHQLGASAAWLGIVCYTLQIYFDFSGYSDMAIGLGRMFGFEFLENFRFPYISRSLTEFWRRWHISLSSWFRDYLYVPLGGNRGGRTRTYFNLVIVFLLCGLWHGASWTFVAWGLFHGLFLVLERLGLARGLERSPGIVRHGYVLLLAVVGWVLFRAESLVQASEFLTAMSGLAPGSGFEHRLSDYWNARLATILALGIVGSTPILPALGLRWRRWRDEAARPGHMALDLGLGAALDLAVLALLIASTLELSAGTHNPFIYFRF